MAALRFQRLLSKILNLAISSLSLAWRITLFTYVMKESMEIFDTSSHKQVSLRSFQEISQKIVDGNQWYVSN